MTNVPVTDADREASAAVLDKLEIAGCYYAREVEKLAQAIARARAEEREACAKVCDNAVVIHFAERMGRCPESDTAQKIAAAIRARGEGGKA